MNEDASGKSIEEGNSDFQLISDYCQVCVCPHLAEVSLFLENYVLADL